MRDNKDKAAKLNRVAGIVVINGLLFVILLWGVNALCGIYLRFRQPPGRETLPNYAADQEHAKDIFRDYYHVTHAYEPFVGWKTRPYKGPTLTINKQGLREIPSSNAEEGKEIIRFFGGSTMWGEGADDENTIPALFASSHPGFRVINHGQLAYNTRQELDALISLFDQDQQADVVIFYDGVNDAAFLCPSVIQTLPSHRLVPEFRNQLYNNNWQLAGRLFYNVFLDHIMTLSEQWKSSPNTEAAYDCLSDPGKAKSIAAQFVRNWEIAHSLVKEHGGQFIGLLQPASFFGDPHVDYLSLDSALQQNARAVYVQIRRILSEKNYDWTYDLTGSFDSPEDIYIDFCHVSSNGNKIIASKISSIIDGRLQPVGDQRLDTKIQSVVTKHSATDRLLNAYKNSVVEREGRYASNLHHVNNPQ